MRLPRAEDLPHHDFAKLANGNVLVLAQEVETRSDYLQEVDRRGRVVWEWWPRDHLDEHFPDRDRRYPDPTHTNSVFELPENRWFDAGDDRFRPGNILVSARNLNAIFIIERSTGEIVWTHTRRSRLPARGADGAEGRARRRSRGLFQQRLPRPQCLPAKRDPGHRSRSTAGWSGRTRRRPSTPPSRGSSRSCPTAISSSPRARADGSSR